MSQQAYEPLQEELVPLEDYVEVFPPHGFLRLVDWHGDELAIVNAARVSFHKESSYQQVYNPDCCGPRGGCDKCYEKSLSTSDQGLIKYLLTKRHGSPFEQGFQSTWHIRLPIFVMREWVRHRIGHSVNEESGRYTEMRSDFFEPDHLRIQTGKPGAYKFELVEDWEMYEEFIDDLCESNGLAWDKYKKWLDKGIAKEQARLFLPLNLYTEIRWTANARSLMHFLGLRNDGPAMFEIKAYAKALEGIFEKYMPVTHQAFIENGRVAP